MIDLLTLGRLELRDAGGESGPGQILGQTKRMALLTYLAIEGGKGLVNRERALALFWPELDQRRASGALRQAVYVLRGALGSEVVVTRGEELGVDPGRIRCDAAAFDEALAAGRLEEALALYQGEFLPAFHFPDADPEFEHWVERQRERLSRGAGQAARRLGRAALESGDSSAAARWARQALEIEPTDEEALRQLLTALDAAGDRGAAVRTYETFAHRMDEEIGVDPSAETQALIQAIRERSETATVPILVSIPRERTGTPASESRDDPPVRRRAALGALALLAVIAAAWAWSRDSRESVAAVEGNAIAVLPFRTSGSSSEGLDDAMVDLLSLALDGAGGARAIDPSSVLAAWDEAAQGRLPDLDRQLELARELGARYAVVGTAVGTRSMLRLAAGLYDTGSGERISRAEVQGPLDGLVPLVDRLSLQLIQSIATEKGDRPYFNLASVTTASSPALKSFLAGEALYRRSRFEQAIPFYESAVEQDSTFALAYLRLYNCYAWIFNDKSVSTFDRLLHLIETTPDRLPPRESLLVRANLALEQGRLEFLGELQEWVLRNPDDAEIWYTLGETYFHLGHQVLAGAYESERAFSRAVELNPRFAPGYIHLIHLAFTEHGDSARAARLIEAHGRLATGSFYDRASRAAFRIAFGDSLNRARGLAAIDTLPSDMVETMVIENLAAPRFFDLAKRLLVILGRDADFVLNSHLLRISLSIARGRTQEALKLLDASIVPRFFQRQWLYAAHATGGAVPEELLERFLAPSEGDSLQRFDAFWMAAYAVDRERWDRYGEALSDLQSEVERSQAEGDTTRAGFFAGTIQALQGYARWKRGDAEGALPLLVAGQRQAIGISRSAIPKEVNAIIRLWTGRLLLETGRPEEAIRYLRAMGLDVEFIYLAPALHDLARAYALTGRDEEAREAYRGFVKAWEDADPELQPVVRRSRQALRRLD